MDSLNNLIQLPEWATPILLMLCAYFLGRLLKRFDRLDEKLDTVMVDIAVMKENRKATWNKIKEHEEEIGDIKNVLIQTLSPSGSKH